MGSSNSTPFDKACFDDVRGAAPIVTLLGGATIHYAIVFLFIYWKNGDTMCGLISGVFKMLWAAAIFICAWISLILDYIVTYRYHAFEEPWNFGDRWQRYNCQIYLFSANANMIHVCFSLFLSLSILLITNKDIYKYKYQVNALIFCGICATLLGQEFSVDGDSDAHVTWIYALLILAAGDLCGAFLSPQDGGLITHTFVGSILYIWFFLIFVLICGGFMCCGFYVVGGGDSNSSYGNEKSWTRIILSHTLCIIVMWCFLLYYIVVNTSMIKFYKGDHYIDAWTETWTEREYDAYLDLIDGNWEQQFNFYFMLLSIGG